VEQATQRIFLVYVEIWKVIAELLISGAMLYPRLSLGGFLFSTIATRKAEGLIPPKLDHIDHA